MTERTDWTDLDGSPLTEKENKKARYIIQEYERAEWVRRRLRVAAPWVILVTSSAVGAITWLSKYFQFR